MLISILLYILFTSFMVGVDFDSTFSIDSIVLWSVMPVHILVCLFCFYCNMVPGAVAARVDQTRAASASNKPTETHIVPSAFPPFASVDAWRMKGLELPQLSK